MEQLPRIFKSLYMKKMLSRVLNKTFDAAYKPWNMDMSPLFCRIAQGEFTDMGKYFVPAFISELKSNSKYDFLRTNKAFENLLADYNKTSNI